MSLPQLLQQWSADQGLTDNAAAPQFGVTPPTFTRWRTGKITPSDKQVPRIASVIGLTPDEVTIARSRSWALADRVEALERQVAELTERERRSEGTA